MNDSRPAHTGAYQRLSPWLDQVTTPSAALVGDLKVDVVIIGAGLTGLTTALALRADGVEVAILESEVAGFGASGRNAGHLTGTVGKDLPSLVRMFGAERGAELAALGRNGVAEAEQLIERYKIDCGYERVGNVLAAVHPRQYRRVDAEAEAATAAGHAGAVLEPADMRAQGLPAGFLRGFHEPVGGVLDPGLYLSGLRDAVVAAGIPLYEGTRVVRVEDGDRPFVETTQGKVSADTVVFATNAYLAGVETPHDFGPPSAPLYVQLFRTEPLDPVTKARVGWEGRQGVYTAHQILESYRLTTDDRIVGGSKFLRYAYRGAHLPDRNAKVAVRLEAVFRARFPELANLRVTEHWGGRIGVAPDFLPVLGRQGAGGRLLFCGAYAGHGLAMASLAGRMVADLVAGRDGPGDVLVNRRRWPLPPEPFRWMGYQAVIRGLAMIDRRADRDLE